MAYRWFSFFAWMLFGLTGSVRGESGWFSPPSSPTEVKVGAYVIDLISIDGATQTFRADIAVRLAWMDPRLAEPGGGVRRMPLDKVWHPRCLVANLRAVDATMPQVVEVDEEGGVVYRQRSLNTYAAPLDLKRFPHDKQRLFVQVVSSGYSLNEVQFVVDPESSGRSDHFTITDWAIGDAAMKAEPYVVPQLGNVIPGLVLEFKVERLTRYYFGTIFATVVIIALMAWLVYWFPISAVNPRVSVSVTSMLALIAYRFVASKDLPKLPYLTQMDFFLLSAALLILIGLATVVAVAREEAAGRKERARYLNRVFRWVYPLILGILVTWFALA